MRTKKKALIICGAILAMTVFLTACEDESSKITPYISDISIPVTNETEDTSLDITTSSDEAAKDEDVTTSDSIKEEGNTETTKSDVNTDKAAPAEGNSTNPQTVATETPQVTQAPVQQAETTANTQTTASSSGSSYEQIYNEYCQKLADYYNTAKGELQSEASSGKSIDALATSCSNKVSRLAEISTEGVNKMADLCVKRG